VQFGTGEWLCRVVRACSCVDWYGRVAVQSGAGEYLRIGTGEWLMLRIIPFVFGRFEFCFALLYVFYIEYVLVIRGRLQFYEKHGKW
jgi:hypothetical protein